ncbi:matrixin family metalloprotease [Halorussus limi]|uniref:Matrixin family metalloprotease n=1 Tax=Halorussus limi TaxID=2938695 RepID=A0A8U0HYK7_9EURY|nr:matrixin family metalloprotease [Halorussus limi]UPV76008.1 matrixin family metalloprotease [Halorussus limi]
MWRTLFVAALLVLSGCATQAPDTGADADGSATHRALTSEDAPTRPNPWGEGELTVAINNTANESRNFRPLVSDALDFWSNNSTRFAGFSIDYELEPNASNPDVVVKFVDAIESCANVSEPAGCAPYVTRGGQVSRPISIEVVGSYSNASTRLILKHELGHTLGLNHSAGPQSVMAPTSQLRTLPRPNATERRLPWADADFTVYLDANRTDDAEATREQVRHALDYYAEGANGTVPENVSFAFTQNRSAADVVVEFTENLPCRTGDSGSCGRVRGNDPDGDGALERYDHLRVTLSDIDTEAVGWHVGYWLGYGFGFEEDADWPAPFRNATYEDRRNAWWR